jgi:hypothetical protein
MKLQILTPEESEMFWEKEKAERRNWTDEQIVADAKIMLSLPDAGNTKWLLPKEYDGFLYWLTTKEAKALWMEDPFTLTLAKYYSQK